MMRLRTSIMCWVFNHFKMKYVYLAFKAKCVIPDGKLSIEISIGIGIYDILNIRQQSKWM